MLTFADLGIPPWDLPPGLVSQKQVRFVAAELVRYAIRQSGHLDNEDRNLLHCHIAIAPGERNRLLFELVDQRGHSLDFAFTAPKLGFNGFSHWVKSVTPIFYDAFGVFDPAEVYDRCIVPYEVDSCQWMPWPATVKKQFMRWPREVQANFLHTFLWWYDRDFYREAPGIEAALRWLKTRKKHVGRWRFELFDEPRDLPPPAEISGKAMAAILDVVPLIEKQMADPWTPSELHNDGQPYEHIRRSYIGRLQSLRDDLLGIPRRPPLAPNGKPYGPAPTSKLTSTVDVMLALGAAPYDSQLPERLQRASWAASSWIEEYGGPPKALQPLTDRISEVRDRAEEAFNTGW